MPLLVGDANIFIDFEEGGILEALFRLPETVAVPDLLFEEELRARHAALLDLGLRPMELSAGALMRVEALGRLYPRPSAHDRAALALAEQEGCPLVTGDRRLREAALAEEVPVFGTLWLMERLFEAGVLQVEQVRAAYARMKAAGSRLPWTEVSRQLNRLTQAGRKP